MAGLLIGAMAGLGRGMAQSGEFLMRVTADEEKEARLRKYEESVRQRQWAREDAAGAAAAATTERHRQEDREWDREKLDIQQQGRMDVQQLRNQGSLGSDDLSGREKAILDGLDSRLDSLTKRYYDPDVMWQEGQREALYEEIEELNRQRANVTRSSPDQEVDAALDGLGGGGDSRQSGGIDGIWQNMIQAESNGQQFDENGRPLTSSAGAIGIAQVMPGTAPEAAEMAGLEWDEERYRNDPEYNEALGRAYFDAQVDKYQDPVLAVAAYNAGPGAVDKWVKQYGDPRAGDLTHEEFVRQIPYDETRNYVLKTLGGVAPEQRSPPMPGVSTAEASTAREVITQKEQENEQKRATQQQTRETKRLASTAKKTANNLQNFRDYANTSMGGDSSEWTTRRRELRAQGIEQMQELMQAYNGTQDDTLRDLLMEGMEELRKAGVPLPQE